MSLPAFSTQAVKGSEITNGVFSVKIRMKTNHGWQLKMNSSRSMFAAALLMLAARYGFAACTQPELVEQRFPFDGYPAGVALTDMNRGGKPDLVVIGYSDSRSTNGMVWILSGRGDGSFMMQTNVVLPGLRNSSLQVGDWNSDGNPDLAFKAFYPSEKLVVFLGSENGTIRAADKSEVPAIGSSVTGDFNRDGRRDLVGVTSDGSLVFLSGNGNGTFQSGTSFASDCRNVDVTDFNRDGNLDLIAIRGKPDDPSPQPRPDVSIFEGRGDGSFQLMQSIPIGSFPADMITADLNGDQTADIVMLKGGFPADASVLIGKKDGTFSTPVDYPVALFQVATAKIRAADLNSDGALDLIVAHGEGLAIFLGVGDGTFQPVQYRSGPGGLGNSVSIGDLNGDGTSDVVVAGELGKYLTSYVNTCGVRPDLSFRRTDAGLLLSWPTYFPEFHLWSTASLTAPTWQRDTADVSAARRDGRWEALISPTNTARFFRLIR